MKRLASRLVAPAMLWITACVVGCAASSRLADLTSQADTTATAKDLRRVLDRWVGWRSLSARVKLTIVAGDSSFTARGHLMYLMGERYQLGFAKPFDRFLGTFYFTPEQMVYWDLSLGPRVFGAGDSTTLSDLIPIPFPEWDPRDLLPFPVSGRSTGFQVNSLAANTNGVVVTGGNDSLTHVLVLASGSGYTRSEEVRRSNRALVRKRYSRTHVYNGWPIARRVACSDSTGRFRFIWRLSDVRLIASPFDLKSDSTVSHKRSEHGEP